MIQQGRNWLSCLSNYSYRFALVVSHVTSCYIVPRYMDRVSGHLVNVIYRWTNGIRLGARSCDQFSGITIMFDDFSCQ